MKWVIMAGSIAALILSLTLLSGKATVNFNHKPNLEALLQDPTFKVEDENGTPAIYLNDSIGAQNNYRSLIAYLNNHKNVPDMYLYLSGNGGQVRASMDLVNTMKYNPTRIHVVLYGDVYSGHAFIAVNGYDIRAYNPNILMLFHRPAAKMDDKHGGDTVLVPETCKYSKGKDRGIDRKTKCLAFAKTSEEAFNRIVLARIYSLMTPDERKRYDNGDDVIIKYGEIAKRLRQLQK
jgi:hypothetical protein